MSSTARFATPKQLVAPSDAEAASERDARASRAHSWFDLLVRAALALLFALSGGAYLHNALPRFQGVDLAHPDAALILDGLSTCAIALYTYLIALIYVLRLRAVNKFAGVTPLVIALVGGFLPMGLLYLRPRQDLSATLELTSDALILIGNVLATIALSHLGRSFSIIPEARRLVTSGPYRLVRHPLYVAEALATLGAMIYFLSAAAVVLVAVQFALQLLRMHYEERVLRETFPEYADYAKRTARIIPRVY